MPTVPYNARQLAEETFVVPGLTNAGFIDGLVIDTCEDEAPFAGVSVDTLAITHGHADHFSSGHALRASGACVHAARDDASLIENPDINIRGMFSWAKPGETLVTKLFQGIPCAVDRYLEDWDDPRAQIVSLPGHTLGHTGFLTCDGVLFTGDALYLRELWQRHPLPYAIDPDLVATSLERLRGLEYEWIVPGHGRPVKREEALDHIGYHLEQIADVEGTLLRELKTERTTEQVVAMISERRGLSENPASYWLAVTTIKGYLGNLHGRGLLEFLIRDHAGWWRTID